MAEVSYTYELRENLLTINADPVSLVSAHSPSEGLERRGSHQHDGARDGVGESAVEQSELGFTLYPTDYPSGSPTQENSPTQYKQYATRWSPRFKKAMTWKVRDAGSWSAILRRASGRVRKRRKRGSQSNKNR